jgi:nitric oxide reductase NorD protein
VSEPEDVIIEAAHVATTAARSLWLRCAAPDDRPRLADFRRRLELFVTTLFPYAPEIGPAEPAAPRSFLARLARAAPPCRSGPFASTDGARIRLPAAIENTATNGILPTYRLLALEQAARAERGMPAWLPTNDSLLRDLFLLAEAAAVDRLLAELATRLEQEIAAARMTARLGRPDRHLTRQEAQVERLVRRLLEAGPSSPPCELGGGKTPAESLAWARDEASSIRALGGRYRGIVPVDLWGSAAPLPDELPAASSKRGENTRSATPKMGRMPRRPRVRTSAEDEDDPQPGIWLPRADDPKESVEDPLGLERPSDREEQGRPGDLGDSLSELPEARLVHTPEAPREVLLSDEPAPRFCAPSPESRGNALMYPEWDWRTGRYVVRGACVRERPVSGGDPSSSAQAVRRHAGLIRRVRREFERLRPRREILRRQPDGTDIDVDAYVVSAADRTAGVAQDGLLYLNERRVRRDAAVLLLVDVSASTDAWVAGARRVIDVAREGLLIVAEALGALGERHAILAFRSEGPMRVDLLVVKQFAEPSGEEVRKRIGALEAEGYTRLGAALRHATALLSREPARHRLLLLLSDGRPNDVDVYEGRYGLEDTRQAMAEARLQSIRPFCLTIDREAPRYACRVFGHRDHALLRNPERLPEVLVAVLRQLLRGG